MCKTEASYISLLFITIIVSISSFVHSHIPSALWLETFATLTFSSNGINTTAFNLAETTAPTNVDIAERRKNICESYCSTQNCDTTLQDDTEPSFYLLHFRKAGGTSMRTFIMDVSTQLAKAGKHPLFITNEWYSFGLGVLCSAPLETKFLTSIRHPVDRLHSLYYHDYNPGHFHKESVADWNNWLDNMNVNHKENKYTYPNYYTKRLTNSEYPLENFWDHKPMTWPMEDGETVMCEIFSANQTTCPKNKGSFVDYGKLWRDRCCYHSMKWHKKRMTNGREFESTPMHYFLVWERGVGKMIWGLNEEIRNMNVDRQHLEQAKSTLSLFDFIGKN